MSSLNLTRILRATLVAGLICAAAGALAGEPAKATQPAPDNTAQNNADKSRQGRLPTADQSSNKKSDIDLMAQIRRSVIAEKDFSIAARNVKIIANDGVITLKGPVKTEREKMLIEKKAGDIAGANRVHNELEVAH